MGISYLRNVQTGEIREIDRDTDEFRELTAEVYDHGDGRAYPRWEQTGDHHVRRVDEGDVNVQADLGYEDKPVGTIQTNADGLQADPHPERELTAAEKNAGIESYEQKVEQLDLSRTEVDEEKVSRGLKRVGRTGSSGSDDGELKGQQLDAALEERGLSKSGTAAEKRQRVADFDADQGGDDEDEG